MASQDLSTKRNKKQNQAKVSKEPDQARRPERPKEPELSKAPERPKVPESSKEPERAKKPEQPNQGKRLVAPARRVLYFGSPGLIVLAAEIAANIFVPY